MPEPLSFIPSYLPVIAPEYSHLPSSRNSICHDLIFIVVGSLPPTDLSSHAPSRVDGGAACVCGDIAQNAAISIVVARAVLRKVFIYGVSSSPGERDAVDAVTQCALNER